MPALISKEPLEPEVDDDFAATRNLEEENKDAMVAAESSSTSTGNAKI